MALDLTSYDPILKSHYVKKKIWALADIAGPFYAMVSKNSKAGGKHIVQPIDYDNPQGGSATIAKAITNSAASKYEDFVITRTKNYQIAYIDNETIEASKTNENAFLPALREIDKAFKQAGRRDAWQIYRSNGGALGRLETGTTLSAAVANLDDHADAFNFQVGMVCTFAAANGTGAERDSGATLTVTDIDREGGTVTFGADLDTITAIADTDYIFAEGDFGLNMAGLADWVPATAPTSTAFYGVDRTSDSDRLGGIRRTASGEPIDETLQKLTATICKHGGMPDCAFLNPERLSDLLLIIGSKSRYEMTTTKGRVANIGFTGFKVMAGGREITLYGDANCPTNRLYVLQKDTWTLHSAGQSPQFLQRDHLLQRSATADSYEVRVGGYRNLGCSAPSYNGVGVLS